MLTGVKPAYALEGVAEQLCVLTYLQICSRGCIPAFRFSGDVIEAFSARQIPIYAMAATGTNLSLAVDAGEEDMQQICQRLSAVASIKVERNVYALSVSVGTSVEACRMVHALKDLPLLMLACHGELLSVVVRASDYEAAALRIALFGKTLIDNSSLQNRTPIFKNNEIFP